VHSCRKISNARSQTPQQNLSFLRVAWLGFEQHLEDASGQGSPAKNKASESEQIHEAKICLGGANRALLRETSQDRTR